MLAALSRKLIDSLYARSGPEMRLHLANLVSQNSEETTYYRLAKSGFAPDGYIDVGAYKGDWTRLAHRTLGTRPTLMVEAQAALIPALHQFAEQQQNLQVAHAVLAAEGNQEVTFHEMGTGSSMFAEASDAPRDTVVLTTQTLDDVANDLVRKTSCLFLKIDVQGAELEVLGGGSKVLSHAALVQLEIAILPYNAGAPLMPETIAWMAARGWYPTEISGYSRPSGPLVQIDLLFAREASPLRPNFFRF